MSQEVPQTLREPFQAQAVTLENEAKKEHEKTWSWQHWKESWRHTPEDLRIPTMPFVYCIFNSEPWPGSLRSGPRA